MLLSVDIETKCAVPQCTSKSCKHALVPHQAKITCIGVWAPGIEGRVYRDLKLFKREIVDQPENEFVGFNFKFDLRMLDHFGIHINTKRWKHDACLMAVADYEKIPRRG